MNTLGEDLTPGTLVMLSAERYPDADPTGGGLLFQVERGPGLSADLVGDTIAGKWTHDWYEDTVRGSDIDPVATRKHWEMVSKIEWLEPDTLPEPYIPIRRLPPGTMTFTGAVEGHAAAAKLERAIDSIFFHLPHRRRSAMVQVPVGEPSVSAYWDGAEWRSLDMDPPLYGTEEEPC